MCQQSLWSYKVIGDFNYLPDCRKGRVTRAEYLHGISTCKIAKPDGICAFMYERCYINIQVIIKYINIKLLFIFIIIIIPVQALKDCTDQLMEVFTGQHIYGSGSNPQVSNRKGLIPTVLQIRNHCLWHRLLWDT